MVTVAEGRWVVVECRGFPVVLLMALFILDLTVRVAAFFVPAFVPVATLSVVRASAGAIRLEGAPSGTSAARSIFAFWFFCS